MKLSELTMLPIFFTITGVVGAIIASFFGGWNSVMSTLGILMVFDYVTGMLVASLFYLEKKI